ncbi:MAG: methyl-accepting chemotaxis protein [Paracoccaceae bacterium]
MSQIDKTKLHHSIFVKVAAMIAIGMIALTAVSSISSRMTEKRIAHFSVSERSIAETEEMAGLVAAPLKFGKTADLDTLLQRAVEHAPGSVVAVAVFDINADVAAQNGTNEIITAELTALAQKAIALGGLVSSEDGLSHAYPVFAGQSGVIVGALAEKWSIESAMAIAYDSETVGFAIGIAATLVILAFVLWGFRWIVVQPLHRIEGAMGALSEHRYETQIPELNRSDEVGQLSRSLEQMRAFLAEGEAAKKENTYKSAAFSGSSAAMMMVDSEFRINFMNAKMQELLDNLTEPLRKEVPDFDPKNVIGQNVDVFHPRHDHFRRFLNSAKDGTQRIVMGIGDSRISLSVAAIFGHNNEIIGNVVEWADITEDWLNGAILSAINTNQVRAEFDVDGRLLFTNVRFNDLFGTQSETFIGRPLRSLLNADKNILTSDALVAEVISAGAYLGKFVFIGAGGQTRIVDGGLSCVRDHAGKALRLLLIGNEVTASEFALAEARQGAINVERQQTQVVDTLRVGLRKLSNGDLTVRIETPFEGNYEELRQDYNRTVENLSKVMRDVVVNAESIKNEARDISSTADTLSRRTESTAATLEQTAASLDGLTESVRSAAEGAAKADKVVAEARINAHESGTIVVETVEAMDAISRSSARITSIIKVIDDIAFQTSILALNAGVEAARAGDAGRGFAVVASEVRALAQRSSEAAREINGLIADSGSQVKLGVDLVGKTGAALRHIVDSVEHISTLVSAIASSSREQSIGLAAINSAVNELDQSTQQNAARLEETTAASEALTNEAIVMSDLVKHFRIDPETESGPRESVVHFKSRSPNAAIPIAQPKMVAIAGVPNRRAPTDDSGWEDF